MIRLWIKGSMEEAQEAAKYRGVPIRNLKANDRRPEVMAETDDEHRKTVIMWFCEDVKCYEGTGYPSGTLLLHN